MKTVFLALALMSSLSAKAYVSECEQNTTLTCKVTYYSQTVDSRVSKSEVIHSSKYELINWDEPSLAYCEASVGFNENDLYIEASLKEESKELGVRMMRSSTGGRSQDQFSSSSVYKPGAVVKGSFSLGGGRAGVYAVEIECQAR